LITNANIISLIYLTLGVMIILLGLIILKENWKRRINRITSCMMLFAGTAPIFAAFGILIQLSSTFDLAPFRKFFLIWEFFFPQMLFFALVFPRENKWVSKNKYITPLIFLPHLLHFVLMSTFSSADQIGHLIDLQGLVDKFGIIVQPLTIILGFILSLFELIYTIHANFFAIVNLVYIIIAITIMMIESQQISNKRLKRQVSLVLWGIRVSVGFYTIAFIFPHLNIIHTSQLATQLLTTSALIIGAGSIAWAIIRYQFLDIRLIMRRGLIFSVVFAVLIGIYLFIYSQGKALITSVLGVEIPILEILFIIISLLFFQPIHRSIEILLEKIFLKDNLDYRNILKELSRDILTTLDIDQLRYKVTTTLCNTMELECASLLLPAPDSGLSTKIEGKIIAFHPEPQTCQVLIEARTHLGFDELFIRCGDDPALENLRPLKPFLLIPLVYRDEMNGLLILSEKNTGSPFTAEDMTILSILADQTAISLENARLHLNMLEKQKMDKELAFAKDIQDNLLPRKSPCGKGYEIAGYNIPSKEVGGDYYDFLELDEQLLGIAIGDISGKGVPAAILMSNLQAALRIAAADCFDTSKVMSKVNVHIKNTTSADKFATFLYGILDTEKLTFHFSNGGHNYPVLKKLNRNAELVEKGGVIIGVKEDIKYKDYSIQLEPGDTLVLYTDGISEAFSPELDQYGEERLLEAVDRGSKRTSSPAELINFILDSVTQFTAKNLHADDLTLIVLKIKELTNL